MKRRMFILAIIACLLSCYVVSAEGFYIKRGKDHMSPRVDPSLEEYLGDSCFYLDRSAADAGVKKIYLTFDAGFENGNIGKILDILKREEVKGAFFVLSHLVKSAPELVKRMAAEGHTVCNHTANHKNMAKLGKEEFKKELRTLEQVYQGETGNAISPYYRPPEGSYSKDNLLWAKEAGYKTVFWSLMYQDWNDDVAPSKEKAMDILKQNTHPGAVVLLHPTSSINVQILGQMINYWKAEGYIFGELDEIL